jgi:hypothetical protein
VETQQSASVGGSARAQRMRVVCEEDTAEEKEVKEVEGAEQEK